MPESHLQLTNPSPQFRNVFSNRESLKSNYWFSFSIFAAAFTFSSFLPHLSKLQKQMNENELQRILLLFFRVLTLTKPRLWLDHPVWKSYPLTILMRLPGLQSSFLTSLALPEMLTWMSTFNSLFKRRCEISNCTPKDSVQLYSDK